jgi:hypothetical protein
MPSVTSSYMGYPRHTSTDEGLAWVEACQGCPTDASSGAPSRGSAPSQGSAKDPVRVWLVPDRGNAQALPYPIDWRGSPHRKADIISQVEGSQGRLLVGAPICRDLWRIPIWV